MLKMRLEITGSLEAWAKDIAFLYDKVKQELRTISSQAAIDMKDRIENSRKRSKTPTNKSHLADLIAIEEIINIGEQYMIGVGNVQEIELRHRDPKFSPDTGKGWQTLNWGSSGLPGKGKHPRGYFGDGAPQAGGGNARFVYDPRSIMRMTPRKPVEGIRFIENAASNAMVKLDVMVEKLI